MRRGSRRICWMLPRTSSNGVHTDSRVDVEDILKAELATIEEEPETCEYKKGSWKQRKHESTGKKKETLMKVDRGHVFTSQFSLRNSYALFLTRMTSKRSYGGLPQY